VCSFIAVEIALKQNVKRGKELNYSTHLFRFRFASGNPKVDYVYVAATLMR